MERSAHGFTEEKQKTLDDRCRDHSDRNCDRSRSRGSIDEKVYAVQRTDGLYGIL